MVACSQLDHPALCTFGCLQEHTGALSTKITVETHPYSPFVFPTLWSGTLRLNLLIYVSASKISIALI